MNETPANENCESLGLKSLVQQKLATLPLGKALIENRNLARLHFNLTIQNGLQSSDMRNNSDTSFDANADLTFLKLDSFQVSSRSIITSVVYDAKIYTSDNHFTTMESQISFMATDNLLKVDESEAPIISRPHSPFPSPKLQRKVQNIIESRHVRLEKSESKVGRRLLLSPLSISIPQQSSDEQSDDEGRIPRKKLELNSAKLRNFNEIIGPFIGKYEESLLNGRLSTSPSKALLFFSEIGAFGAGKCKPSLKCPRHLVVPFNVVFYHLSDVEIPTPYVGLVEFPEADDTLPLEHGCYRLPLKGQLQIVT